MPTKPTILFASVMIFLSACATNIENNTATTDQSTNNSVTNNIQIDGSSTVYPITEAVAEELRYTIPEIQVTVGLSGTGGGFKKFCRGEIDINNASRPIKDSEIELCQKANIDYLPLSIAYDGLAVLVHPENSWVDHLTTAELKKIWEPAAQNKILKWNQIRPHWPEEELHLYGPGTASGTYDYFTEAIVGESGQSRGDYTASEDDNVLVQGIANDKFALGFFGLAYYQENKSLLKLVPVDNGVGAILPNKETVENGTYSPLSRPLFIYLSTTALNKPAVSAFAEFYLQNAAALAGEVGYIALPSTEYTKQMQTLKEFLSTSS